MFQNEVSNIIIYLESKCTEKYQFGLCSKYVRAYDFDIILRKLVLCRKLRLICRKHSNDVKRQVVTPTRFVLLHFEHENDVTIIIFSL